MIHDFDQMNRLLGTPRSVFASEPQPGHVHALVEYDGAAGDRRGQHAHAALVPVLEQHPRARRAGRRRVRLLAAPVEGEGNIGASSSARGLRVYPAAGERAGPVEAADPWGPEIAYFVSCLEQGRPPEQGTGEQARAALAVSLAANRSLASGRPEDVVCITGATQGRAATSSTKRTGP